MKNVLPMLSLLLGLILFAVQPALAKTQDYALVIEKQAVHITGTPLKRITVNGSIPGPTLYWTEGDEAVIHVTNKMGEDTSVHWHGLLLPGEMDGVPGLNGFDGIKPGETFTYRFKIRQAGTYWYHAHTMGQEHDGLYGSIVIHPQKPAPQKEMKDHVVVLSDFHHDTSSTIMANLKKTSDYYNYTRQTVGDFWQEVKRIGFSAAWANAKMWDKMRMLPTDLADINNFTFLVNGKTPDQNWTGLFTPGQPVKLRFINASAMSIFDLRIPGLKMTVVAADGQDVEPVTVDEFRFGVAETYDVILTPPDDKAYTIAAEPIDRSGFALATLAPRDGMRGATPAPRPRALLTMADMGMGHDMPGMDHSAMGHGTSGASGWADASTPAGHKALAYKDLRLRGTQPDRRQPGREIVIHLGGNMARYIWTLNGQKYDTATPLFLKFGERVRLTYINDTMMAHPMHLHGMFVQLENGQPMEKLPNKHTVIVPPASQISMLLTANEPGAWAIHCHLLYHMLSGMMNHVVVESVAPASNFGYKELNR